ncbi:uncharacterized protein LOC131930094 [Physella acuta]|uniref:uncharacterized protein LOC131930094 n=1 Tax=Physella acuta TaxID=109671 RepID=UPI0027DE5346|nr:uncharacterized protein LOC131930094 [Physella acuta]
MLLRTRSLCRYHKPRFVTWFGILSAASISILCYFLIGTSSASTIRETQVPNNVVVMKENENDKDKTAPKTVQEITPKQEPSAANKDPANKDPANANKDPANANKDPANANKDPANANKDPANANKDPANANKDPANANKDPSNANKDPPTTTTPITKAPPIWPGVDYLNPNPKEEKSGPDNDVDNIRLYRDLYAQESWPGVEPATLTPGEIPSTLHYFWCGKKVFKFEDYLGLLSAVRIIKPQKIIFHHETPPYAETFWYHTWFQEMKQSLPNFILRHTTEVLKCGTEDVLRFVLKKLSSEGGIYIGERTIVTGIPKELSTGNFYSSFRENGVVHDVTQGVIYSKEGFPENTIEEKIQSFSKTNSKCLTIEELNSHAESLGSKSFDNTCVVVWSSVFPKDSWNSTTKFAELARWLFYGQRARFETKLAEKDSDMIPLLSHIVWIQHGNDEFNFLHFLSVISALHVAGFQRVYVHGDARPHGQWWDKLSGENVTYVKIESPEVIFQQRVGGAQHQSDVLRLNILLKYGGTYQDRDVIWVSRIPDSLRRYPAITCPDWPENGAWPEVFNMGVFMAKPNAEYLKTFLKTFSYYRDDKWAFNAVFMPYKAYEEHPDQLYVDRHLQIICFEGICHPAWHENYIRGISDKRPVDSFDWRDGRSFHFTVPKPPGTLTSPENIRNGKDIFAEMGRFILEKSGRTDLLKP